ncbi:hypothetical protein [Sphingomonas sp.]|nr:hypothetical protein [Sphingomonas sp.]MBV9527528.1 hypothetical protein [Sphingomonas sp.]
MIEIVYDDLLLWAMEESARLIDKSLGFGNTIDGHDGRSGHLAIQER